MLGLLKGSDYKYIKISEANRSNTPSTEKVLTVKIKSVEA